MVIKHLEKYTFQKGQIPWNKGKKMTYKHGFLGKKHTSESKKKMSIALMGRTVWNKGEAMGVYGTPFYKVWQNIKTRCYNKNTSDYKRYGGRGIRVCKRWHNFKSFYKDMFDSYKKGLTIERIDNNKNYSRENCRWATRREQANNTRHIKRAKKYCYKGIEDTIKNWANYLGIKRSTLDMRLRSYNWSIEKAFFKPVKGGVSYGR